MPATPLSGKITAPSDWPGPLNPGSGCLGCLPVGLRGKSAWFPRRNALAGPRNCTDPEPGYVQSGARVQTSSTSLHQNYCRTDPGGPSLPEGATITYCYLDDRHGALTVTTPLGGGDPVYSGTLATQRQASSTTYTGAPGWENTSTDTGVVNFDTGSGVGFGNGGEPGSVTTTEDTPDGAGGYTRTVTTTWDSYSGGPAPGSAEYIAGNYSGDPRIHYVGTVTDTISYRLDEDTEEEADAAVDAAEDEEGPYDWGADADAQFPWLLPPGLPGGEGYGLGTGKMDPLRQEYPAPATPLLIRTSTGRKVLRARLAVEAGLFPGQVWRADWVVVKRRLGWGVARSGSAPGRTETTRTRAYTLSEPMGSPEDALGPLSFGDASWGSLGYALQTVPPTPPAPAPGEPANPPSAGLRVASRLRRSRLRFAVRVPGVVTFKLRKLTVLDSDHTDYTPALATVTTEGTLSEDGTNSTAAVDYAPPDQTHSVYLFVDEVLDADGQALAVGEWLAPGKVRDGWLGFLQLDHATVQAASVYYRRLEFTQETTVEASYVPDPENPPGEEDAACYEGTGEDALPWLDFTQSQTWVQVAGATGLGDWELSEASGSCGGVTWEGEVSPFDEPLAVGAGGGWTVGQEVATLTETEPVDAEEQNGALWVDWSRVEPVLNPRFGGVTVGVEAAGGVTSAATYEEGEEPLVVQESAVVYLSAGESGESVQVVNLHVRGA